MHCNLQSTRTCKYNYMYPRWINTISSIHAAIFAWSNSVVKQNFDIGYRGKFSAPAIRGDPILQFAETPFRNLRRLRSAICGGSASQFAEALLRNSQRLCSAICGGWPPYYDKLIANIIWAGLIVFVVAHKAYLHDISQEGELLSPCRFTVEAKRQASIWCAFKKNGRAVSSWQVQYVARRK